jgi:hypothetical protein
MAVMSALSLLMLLDGKGTFANENYASKGEKYNSKNYSHTYFNVLFFIA